MPDDSLLATIQPEPRRDRWGRYKLPDPRTGRDRVWTRATTLVKSASDTYGLDRWSGRMIVKGIAARPDLNSLAAATPMDDRAGLDKLAEQAKEAAASSSGAVLGNALHLATAAIDRGEKVTLPPPLDVDLVAYRGILDRHGLVMRPHLIERIVVCDQFSVAGTFDRVLQVPDVGLVVGDVKSGQSLDYGGMERAGQLALYANADAMWNGVTGNYEEMPKVRQDYGLIIHLPAGQAKAELQWVDLAAGWELVHLCAEIRKWRARKDLSVSFDLGKRRMAADAPGALPRRSRTKVEAAVGESLSKAADHLTDDELDAVTSVQTYPSEARAVVEAASITDLYGVWESLDAAGRWTEDLTKLAAQRKAELTK